MQKAHRYRRFRQEMSQMLGKGKDATFELMDSVMTTRNAYCLGEFSLSPLFRRKWHSTYEAIQDCRPNRNKLMKRYIQEIPELEYVLLAIDRTAWELKDAKTMKDRGYQHSASSKNSSVLGQGYSTIAWLPEAEASWRLPLRHERITSFETPISKARWQLQQVCQEIQQKVLVVLDCEYGNSSWINQTADLSASKLMRIRSNCCLYAEPENYTGKGRPKRHGRKFKVNDEATWWQADFIVEINDSKLGLIRVSKWQKLHFKTAYQQQLSLIKVERLNHKKTGNPHRPLWLVWVGEEFLTLEKVWSQYARRFGVDHWYRFAKQRLHWTLPSFSTPQQCEKWSDRNAVNDLATVVSQRFGGRASSDGAKTTN